MMSLISSQPVIAARAHKTMGLQLFLLSCCTTGQLQRWHNSKKKKSELACSVYWSWSPSQYSLRFITKGRQRLTLYATTIHDRKLYAEYFRFHSSKKTSSAYAVSRFFICFIVRRRSTLQFLLDIIPSHGEKLLYRPSPLPPTGRFDMFNCSRHSYWSSPKLFSALYKYPSSIFMNSSPSLSNPFLFYGIQKP